MLGDVRSSSRKVNEEENLYQPRSIMTKGFYGLVDFKFKLCAIRAYRPCTGHNKEQPVIS